MSIEKLDAQKMEQTPEEEVLGVIKEIKKSNPEKFKRENISSLADEVLILLEKRHNVDLSVLVSGAEVAPENAEEDKKISDFTETYLIGLSIEDILKKYITK
jgi:hypothetical protein